MKKLSKRFLTLAIACVMAMAMAVPTFAAAPKRAAYMFLSADKNPSASRRCVNYFRIGDSLIIFESYIRD